ncbi:MAG: hypothetical protein ACYTHJ_04730 [Planctomycetota bacterium]|jgi:hypothetical protein
MPIKIISAPGDHRDDFQHVEAQFNDWESENNPKIIDWNACVESLPTQRDLGSFMLTLVIRYDA